MVKPDPRKKSQAPPKHANMAVKQTFEGEVKEPSNMELKEMLVDIKRDFQYPGDKQWSS